MPVTPEQLQSVPLFARLDKKALRAMASEMRDRTVPAGSDLIVQGEQGVGFFVILSGEAEVTVDGEARRTLGAGAHFGEVAMFVPDALRTASVTAKTDLEVATIAAWRFRPLVQEQPDMAWALLETLARQMA